MCITFASVIADRLTVDHSLCAQALPPWVSAPSKRSFSSVNSPSLRSDFSRRRSAGVGCVLPPGPKTSDAPFPQAAPFHDVSDWGALEELSYNLARVRIALDCEAHLRLEGRLWFRAGSSLHQWSQPDFAQPSPFPQSAEAPLIALSKFPGPALCTVEESALYVVVLSSGEL